MPDSGVLGKACLRNNAKPSGRVGVILPLVAGGIEVVMVVAHVLNYGDSASMTLADKMLVLVPSAGARFDNKIAFVTRYM